MGIAFAIPMDEAMRVADQLRAGGKVTRGRIGVTIGPVSKEVADSIGLGKSSGALVNGVEAGSPAEKAGVEAGDIILKFDGKTIDKSTDLPRLVGGTKPGTRSTLTVFRRGANKDLSVTIAEVESDKPAAKASAREEKSKLAAQAFGLSVAELSDVQKKELNLKGGVRVEAAVEGAARAGLREGDVIVQVGNLEVMSVKDFDAAIAKSDKNKALPILFRRDDWTQYVVIRPSRQPKE